MNNEQHKVMEAQDLLQQIADESYFRGYCMGSVMYYDFLYNGMSCTVGHSYSTSPYNAYIHFLNAFSGTYMPKTYHHGGIFGE